MPSVRWDYISNLSNHSSGKKQEQEGAYAAGPCALGSGAPSEGV